jgi:hypothetical protein
MAKGAGLGTYAAAHPLALGILAAPPAVVAQQIEKVASVLLATPEKKYVHLRHQQSRRVTPWPADDSSASSAGMSTRS